MIVLQPKLGPQAQSQPPIDVLNDGREVVHCIYHKMCPSLHKQENAMKPSTLKRVGHEKNVFKGLLN
jgi:hypothetical protein